MKTVEVQHSDFLTEIMPYYEYLEEDLFIIGDPFNICKWHNANNKIRRNSKVSFAFAYPFFLDEAIMYDEIPIGYRYNDNIVFCLSHPQLWSKSPNNHKTMFKKYIQDNNNTPLPNYQEELESRLVSQFTNFKPSDDLIGILKKQYFRASIQKSIYDAYTQSSNSSKILDEISLVERSIKFHNNPQKLVDESFYKNAYREFKKIWIDQDHHVYIWYQGFLRQNYSYPIAIHDLLFVIDIMNNRMSGDKIFPLTSYRVDGAGSFHPHVNTGGRPCTGRNQNDLDRYHHLHDLQGLIDVYIQYMNRYTGDGAYQRIDYWLCGCGNFYRSERVSRHTCSLCSKNSCDACRGSHTNKHRGCIQERESKKELTNYDKFMSRKHTTLDNELWSTDSTTAMYTLNTDGGGTDINIDDMELEDDEDES